MLMADRRAARLRPARFDDLGVRRALDDALLPVLVAAMAFLAALACSGFTASAEVARRWQEGATASVTIQVARPGEPASGPGGRTRREAVLGLLHATPGLASVRALTDAELSDLLRPWLGAAAETLSLPLPAAVAVQLSGAGTDLNALAAKLEAAAPGTVVERHDVLVRRLQVLTRTLEACAGLVLGIVVMVAALVVAMATRAGLAARREAIEIAHGLGATDGYIAGRFARRATRLVAAGATAGAAISVPVLVGLAAMAAPFLSLDALNQATPSGAQIWSSLGLLPVSLWAALPILPSAACVIGWAVAQVVVRRWLRQLP